MKTYEVLLYGKLQYSTTDELVANEQARLLRAQWGGKSVKIKILKKRKNRRTYIGFQDQKQQQEAIDFLNRLNIPYEANLKSPYWLSVTAKRFTANYLDLYLEFNNALSAF